MVTTFPAKETWVVIVDDVASFDAGLGEGGITGVVQANTNTRIRESRLTAGSPIFTLHPPKAFCFAEHSEANLALLSQYQSVFRQSGSQPIHDVLPYDEALSERVVSRLANEPLGIP